MEFLKHLKKELKDPFTSILDEGQTSAEFESFIDTGSYALNALLSGTIFGGFADNKVIALAGAEAVGKTFYSMALIKSFLDTRENSIGIIYDTESATTKKMFADRNIDPKRIMISEPETVQQFKNQALKLVDVYMKSEDRPQVITALDSLGQLSTTKEMADSLEGSDTRDMTRSQQIKSAFRTIRLKFAKAKIPLIVTNHIYDVVGSYIPMKEMSGGSGLKYAADYIIFLTKKKDRDEKTKQVVGNIITATAVKSRLSKADMKVETLLSYDKGLDRYYGLLDMAIEAGIFTKLAKGYEFADTGKRVFEGDIEENPEKFYTEGNLLKIDAVAREKFSYGSATKTIENLEESDDNVESD